MKDKLTDQDIEELKSYSYRVVNSPNNNENHRKIRQAQLELIARALDKYPNRQQKVRSILNRLDKHPSAA